MPSPPLSRLEKINNLIADGIKAGATPADVDNLMFKTPGNYEAYVDAARAADRPRRAKELLDKDAAERKLAVVAKALASQDNITIPQAWDRLMQTPEGAALYEQTKVSPDGD